MNESRTVVLVLLVSLAACDHHRAVASDGSAVAGDGFAAADAGARCTKLSLLGKVNALGEIPGMSRSPAITADDTGFEIGRASCRERV